MLPKHLVHLFDVINQYLRLHDIVKKKNKKNTEIVRSVVSAILCYIVIGQHSKFHQLCTVS